MVHARQVIVNPIVHVNRCCTRVRLAWADAAYAGKLATWAASLTIQLKIVASAAHALRGAAPPLSRRAHPSLDHRSPRYARDYERVPEGHVAMVLWAMVAWITQHLATQRP